LVIVFWHMPQANDGFQTLERQLDLPPEPIALQYLPGGGPILWQGCEHQDVTGVFSVFRRVFAFTVLLFERSLRWAR
jgi:hypothetical protein